MNRVVWAFGGLLLLAGCDSLFGSANDHCTRPDPASLRVGATGLDTTINAVPVALGPPRFSGPSIDAAAQELTLLSDELYAACREELAADPNTAAGQIVYARNQTTKAQLTTLAIQLSAATNDRQVDKAVAAARNVSAATATQQAATPPTATVTAAPPVATPVPLPPNTGKSGKKYYAPAYGPGF